MVEQGEMCPTCGYVNMTALDHTCSPLWGVASDDPKGIDEGTWASIYANTAAGAAVLFVRMTDETLNQFTEFARIAVAPYDRLSERTVFEVRGRRTPRYSIKQVL